MTPITETDDLYPETVPLLELTDPVLGGPSGPSNAAAIALANRTRYLKAALEALGPGGAGSAENIGTGTGLYLGTEAGVLQFLSLLEGTGVTLTPLPTGLRIDVTGGGEGGVSGTSARIKVVTTDFGAIGDGTTADRAAFEAAHAGTDPDWPIVVPSGNYNLGGTDLVTNGRRWILEGTTTFTAGKLRQCMFERHNPMGTVDVWYDRAATMFEQRTPFRLGGQSITPALSIGSADPDQSPFGSVLYADGHSNFLALKPEEPFNPMEINLYSYAYSGRANGVAGTNRILRNIISCPASMPWTPEMVGKCLYFGGVRYKVLSRVSDGEITVAAWPSMPVSFTSTAEATYHFTYTMFRGRCSTSGTAVTWKSGHKFFGYLESWNPSSMIVINGVSYTVSSVTDMEHLVLTASAGTQADVAFVGYAEVDGETTAFRMNHAITGEQLTFMTSAGALDGKGPAFLIKTDKGVGSWNPIVMQNGGQDGLTVAYNTPAGRAFVGIGHRHPVCELDVDGDIKNTHLTLRENAIERHDEDVDGSVIAINYNGYNGGATRYRNAEIYDGKGNLIARFNGASRVVDFVNPPTVGGVPISGGGAGVASVVDVTAFGAVGDFVPAPGSTGSGTDNSAAFNSAIATGKTIYIPDGNFYVANPTTKDNLSRANSTGPGRVWASTNVGKARIGKTLSIGTTRSHEVNSVGGLLIGGESGDGMRQWMGHHNWMQFQPSRDGAPNQVQIYSSANLCSASCQSPNILNAATGTFNLAKMAVGDHVGWYGKVYKLSALTSAGQIQVTNFDGTSPAFTTNGIARPFAHAYESAEGICNVSGTTVTYVSGDQYPYGVTGDHMYALINGVRYPVALGPESVDANHITLATSAGTQTGVPIIFRRCYGPWAYISLLRLQGLGGGVETNCGLYLNIRGEAVLYNGATSDNLAGPLRINAPRVSLGPGNGAQELELIDITADYVDIGGKDGSQSLRIFPGAANGNRFEMDGVPSGEYPALSTRGFDPNITMILDSQGTGGVRFTAGSRSYRSFESLAPAGSVTWPYVSSHAVAAEFGVLGAATNIDMNLVPKGADGRVLVKGIPLFGAFRIDANKTTDTYTLVNVTLQDVRMSIVNIDVGAMGAYSTTTQRFTFAAAGTYRITADVMFDCVATGSLLGYLFVRKNGSNLDGDSIKTAVPATSLSPGQVAGAKVSGLLKVAAGDYIKLHNFVSLSGTWATTANAQALTSMSIERIA